MQYGHCTKECGDAETALLLYREAEKLRPAEADVQLHLGHALKLLDRREEACEAYARALSLDPGNAAARAEALAAELPSPAEAAPPPPPAADHVFTLPTCSNTRGATGHRSAYNGCSST